MALEIQGVSHDNGSGASQTCSSPAMAAQTAGNTNVVLFTCFDGGGGGISSVADTAGNTYTQAIGGSSSGTFFYIYYSIGIAAHAAGNIVTVTRTVSTGTFCSIVVSEYTDITAFDAVCALSFGTGTAVASANVTTTATNDILVGCVNFNGAYSSMGAGWNTEVVSSPSNITIADQVGVSIGTYSVTGTLSISKFWMAAVAGFKTSTTAPPLTSEQAATNLTIAGAATLNGKIELTGGANATVRGFHWGLTIAYGNTTVENGSFGIGAFTATLTGLGDGSIYHIQAYATNANGTGVSKDRQFQMPSPFTKGEVRYTTQIGTPGTGFSNYFPINLIDGNDETPWVGPDSTGDWAGYDAGIATQLTRIRISPVCGYEDWALGALLQASNDPTFVVGTVTLLTISTRPVTGNLLNEYDFNLTGSNYEYFRYVGTNGYVADLDCIGFYMTGVVAAACDVTFTPFGGVYDLPTVIKLSCLTTDASIYYTTDGSTPTSGSTLYTGPFILSVSATVKAIAVSANLTNSRVTSQLYSIGGGVISLNPLSDFNRGYRIKGINTSLLLDPVSGYWFMYLFCTDGNFVYDKHIGINVYQSADFVNWAYAGIVVNPPAGLAINYPHFQDSQRCVYNPHTQKYVMWTRESYLTQRYFNVYTSTSPTGPFTQQSHFSSLDTFSPGGNLGLLQDSDGVSCYLYWASNNNTKIGITKLSSDYLSTDGGTNIYWNNDGTSPFGKTTEGFGMCLVKGVYYWMDSGATNWQPNTNLVVTAFTPLGPWGAPYNPYQNVMVPQTTDEANHQATPIIPSYTNAYDSQAWSLVVVPGRGLVAFVDRYDLPDTLPGSSGTISFNPQARILMLPATTTGGVLSITWNNGWTLDGMFKTGVPGPLPPSGMNVSGGSFSWINNDPAPVTYYLDYATDQGFFNIVRSEVIGMGTGITSYTPIFPYSITGFYRLRLVNFRGEIVKMFPQNVSPVPTSVIAPGAGYYIVLDNGGAYTVLNLQSATNYAWLIQSIAAGPFSTYGGAVQALITGPYWPSV
jgi:hypothetical protein